MNLWQKVNKGWDVTSEFNLVESVGLKGGGGVWSGEGKWEEDARGFGVRGMLKPIIQYLVNTASWSCVNKIPQNKWLTQRTIFMGLETGSPEERELVKTNETEWGGDHKN